MVPFFGNFDCVREKIGLSPGDQVKLEDVDGAVIPTFFKGEIKHFISILYCRHPLWTQISPFINNNFVYNFFSLKYLEI